MKIYRIDGNRCFSEPLKGLSYHTTKELAEKHLKKRGFYLETRKWEHIEGHEPNTPNKMWYNIKLSEDGYSFDNTRYCFITEIDVHNMENINKKNKQLLQIKEAFEIYRNKIIGYIEDLDIELPKDFHLLTMNELWDFINEKIEINITDLDNTDKKLIVPDIVGQSKQLVICKKCGSSEVYQYTKEKDKCEDCGNVQDYQLPKTK